MMSTMFRLVLLIMFVGHCQSVKLYKCDGFYPAWYDDNKPIRLEMDGCTDNDDICYFVSTNGTLIIPKVWVEADLPTKASQVLTELMITIQQPRMIDSKVETVTPTQITGNRFFINGTGNFSYVNINQLVDVTNRYFDHVIPVSLPELCFTYKAFIYETTQCNQTTVKEYGKNITDALKTLEDLLLNAEHPENLVVKVFEERMKMLKLIEKQWHTASKNLNHSCRVYFETHERLDATIRWLEPLSLINGKEKDIQRSYLLTYLSEELAQMQIDVSDMTTSGRPKGEAIIETLLFLREALRDVGPFDAQNIMAAFFQLILELDLILAEAR